MAYFTDYICCYNIDNDFLLLNTLTSAIDIVDNETYLKIKDMIDGVKEISSKDDPELYKTLKNRGYIYDSIEGQDRVLNTLWNMNNYVMSKRINTKFTICPTMGCNLRCTYCFETDDQHKNLNSMTDIQLNVIFDYIKESCNQINDYQKLNDSKFKIPQPTISLFGGEPLLKSNYTIIKKIFEFAGNLNLPIQIVTNGTTIDDFMDLLTKYKNQIAIQITIDGNKDTHDSRRMRADKTGTFDEICDGISKLLDIGIVIHLRINIDKENLFEIVELKQFFDKKGWNNNHLFLPYASPVRCFKGDKNIPENILDDSYMLDYLMKNGFYGKKDSFLKEIVSPAIGFVTRFFGKSSNEMKEWKTTYCEGTMGSNYCFSPDGSISTCLTCVGNKEYSIGTFGEKGIDIDDKKLELWTKRDPFKMKKCDKCKFILFCGGGCPVDSLEGYGDINCAVCNDIEKTLEAYVKNVKYKILVNANI